MTDFRDTHYATKLATLVSATGAFLVAASLTCENELIWMVKVTGKTQDKYMRRASLIFDSFDRNPMKSHLLFGS